ncbi:hypothetical protein HPB51_019893 [Rhipicephalus microplus]|uniref:Uncharacterized protein n=1 Tax=Rhipicephalus microplus TaxID=6941 RepID=A0A9J6E2W4_RHIMP|nr:hypothetical protein HPB51_019893 [Rhipicephalus microplus]
MSHQTRSLTDGAPSRRRLAPRSVRVITVVVLFPVLRRTGYQLSARQAMVLAWVTLKGPVTMVGLSTRAVGALGYVNFVAVRLYHVLSVVEGCLITAFTVTPLMRFLESSRMRRSMKSIWEAAAKSRERQRAQRNFSGADWKWIEEHIYLADLLSVGYQLEKVEPQEPSKPARKQKRRKLSNRLNRITKVMFKDDFTERLGSSLCALPSHAHPAKAYAELNRNIRTLQTVSLRRQFERGMIHPETYAKILTAIQIKVKDESFLDLPTMKALLYLPPWMFAFVSCR